MRNSAERGFTLIEIMVALAVFSLAVLALVRLEGATVRGAGLIDETTAAQMVARNVALDALTEAQPPAPGRSNGTEVNGGRTWQWTRQVSSTGEATVVRIDVAVANVRGQIVGRAMIVRPPSSAAVVGVSS
jgi:general secretion pathway protein I